jgi:magnesium chelatase family protein
MYRECRCTQSQILKYQNRISGPLLDRIDIQVGVHAVPIRDIERLSPGESSAVIRERVLVARAIQRERYRAMPGVITNSEAKSRDLKDICMLSSAAMESLRDTMERLRFSARAYDRVLRVARTCADLAGRKAVELEDVMQASAYRQLDGGRDSFFA